MNGGNRPESAQEWHQVCEKLNIPCVKVWGCACVFTARLRYEDRLDSWVIFYNPYVSDRQACRFLAHEIGEYLAIVNYSDIFNGLPQPVYHYTGGSDPHDARHSIARRAEDSLCPSRVTDHARTCRPDLLPMEDQLTPNMSALTTGGIFPKRAADLEEIRREVLLFRDQVALCDKQIALCDKQIRLCERQTRQARDGRGEAEADGEGNEC